MNSASPSLLDQWVSSLNESQLEAYQADGHCAVLAGPGSGKTRLLVAKVAQLLNQRPNGPRGVACVTFNNDAVKEMRKRLGDLGLKPSKRLFVGTVHSFCLACIVAPFGHLFRDDLANGITVATEPERYRILDEAINAARSDWRVEDLWKEFSVYRRKHPIKNETDWRVDPETAGVIETYEQLLHDRGLIDFDDMVLIALDLVRRHKFVRSALEARFPFLVIDEYQDLGYPLHLIVRSLMDTTEVDVFAVGDPDQSIYGFAGADPKYLREMAADHGVKQVQLGMNYRSAQEIIDSSQVALAVDPPRAYESARKGASGELGFLECQNGITEQARTIAHSVIPSLEHRGVAKGQIAVLYIDRADALVLTRALDDAGIQFAGERDHRYQRTPFTRWLEDVAVWCSLFPETQEGPEFEEIFHWYANTMAASYPSIAINDLAGRTKFFEALTSVTEPHMLLAEWLGRLDHLLELENCLTALPTDPGYIANWKEINENCQEGRSLMGFRLDDFARCGGRADTVTLTTLHSSKGLEYEAVIIPGLEQGRLPDFRAISPEALEEARRVFYVGMTRAKDTVYLLYSGWYENQFGRKFEAGPSQFVQELQARARSRTDVVSL